MRLGVLGLLLVLALVSIGDAYYKSYPLFFLVFIFFQLVLSGVLAKDVFYPAALFLFVSVSFSLLHASWVFEVASFVKLLLNFAFFVSVSSYVVNLDVRKAIRIFRVSSLIFICLSFLQVLYVVSSRGLWLLPFQLESSSDSYVFEGVVFGDLNKNIWASKVAIFMIIATCCFYLLGRGLVSFLLCLCMGAFVLLYVSSRAAQLSFVAFFAVITAYHLWFVARRRFLLILLAVLFSPMFFALFEKIARFGGLDFSEFNPEVGGHMGDGFLARIIIWNHVLQGIDCFDLLWGNGILSFASYTGGIFPENNPHNTFLNVLMDFGLVALLFYIFILWRVSAASIFSRSLLIPLLVLLNSQYLGYDSEIMIFLAFVFFVGSTLSRENLKARFGVPRLKFLK
ncbi:O-antigen ligase family protein [Pseudomonas flexibilis]|uniref:O-Antigen ligase n=1 Tax=Pseudomonas flexibilis TaxID=706570 RepID=A0A1N6WXX5_9PSED|nr:O-antigen ligase family protein [Pseudomonas flexibilis]SIQ94918.1 O-Antigen ligase [Pseudomonas flexibilis]